MGEGGQAKSDFIWQGVTFADQNTLFILILKNKMNLTRKRVCHIYSPLSVWKIWAHLARLSKQWFFTATTWTIFSCKIHFVVKIFENNKFLSAKRYLQRKQLIKKTDFLRKICHFDHTSTEEMKISWVTNLLV